jgi:diguanylate cyclase (GGDEF)-like protein/PAS domain S-box-containing protein
VLLPQGSSILLANLLDRLDETIFLVDVEDGPTFRYRAISGRVLDVIPGGRDRFLGRTPIEALGPESGPRAEGEMRAVLAQDGVRRYEATYELPDGQHVASVRLWPLDGGSQIGGVVRDVTRERNALRSLSRRESFNRAVLDAIPSSTAVVSQQGEIRATNSQWVRGLGDAGMPVAMPGDDFFRYLDHLPDVAIALRGVLDGDRELYETDYLERGRWLSFRAVPVEIEGVRSAIVSCTDVTERVEQHEQLAALHRQWQAAFESAPIGMCTVDRQGRYLRVNPKLCEMLGRTEEELLRCTSEDVTPPGHRVLRERLRQAPASTDGMVGTEKPYLRADGSVMWAWVTWSEVADGTSAPTYFIQIQDITPRKLAEARLADQRSLLELVAGGAPLEDVLDAVVQAGERHVAGTQWVAIATTVDGVRAAGVEDAHAVELAEAYRAFAPTRWREARGIVVVPPDGGSALGAALRLGGAWTLPVVEEGGQVSGFLVVNDAPAVVDPMDAAFVEQLGSIVRIAVHRDATTRRLAERLLEDGLTGLPSRTLFHRRAEHALARVGSGSAGIAVLTIDLDRFGRVNESLGHLAGDEVLAEVARRLQDVVGSPDTVARGGGDQFLVLLEDVAGDAAAMATAERIAEELRRPIVVEELEFSCPGSIGVVWCGDRHAEIQVLESQAALAMAAAKQRGRDRAQVYSADLQKTQPRLTLERELLRAVAEEQFEVHYQPEVALDSNRIVGVEALVRWRHPERGLLPPADFVGAAEESGAIVEIGRQVLAESCARLAEWSAVGGFDLTVAVNLSARQLADPGLVEFIRQTLERHHLEPSRLVLEMTESTLVDDTDRASDVFTALRDLGVRVAIDDFGTGYSSLVYLKRFPADVLKVDRSFVDGLGTDPGDSAIVAAVVRLAHRLDLTVIAEGVETAEQLAHLRRLGCEQGQGYVWGRPMPADDIAELLRSPLPDVPTAHVATLEVESDRSELDELLAVLTHELSTPLTVIGGYAEMLADRLDADSGARTGVAAIERNVHNLGRLVAALADARGLGAGGTAVPFDAVAFVGQAVADLTPILDGHRVDLDMTSRPAPVLADPVGLSQILTNLVGNATKFTDPGDLVQVRVGVDKDLVRIAVVDHGPGVPPERVEELFGRFARLGSTRRGLGLGLYLSRAIARRHGGDVVHEHTPGGGASFVVTLPLRTEER